jgi:hypothetical protein
MIMPDEEIFNYFFDFVDAAVHWITYTITYTAPYSIMKGSRLFKLFRWVECKKWKKYRARITFKTGHLSFRI